MDRSSRGLSLALVLSASALYQQTSLAATSCTATGTSYFGLEVYAAPQTPNGSGQYLYKIAGLRCSGGIVVKWNEGTNWLTPDQMLETTKTANTNMKRAFPNTCKTHLVLLHDSYTGTVDGVAATQFAVGKQTYYDEFAGPIFYDRPTTKLTCPETSGIGDPDQPGTCPAPGADTPLQSPAIASMGVADPVNVSNGNSYQVEVDYPGLPGTQMNFARYYNSKTLRWTHTYSAKLKIATTEIMLVNTDGRESLFTVSGGVATASATELGRLEQTASGWRYDNTYNEHLHFNSLGQLTRIDRANGTYETLTYGTNTAVITDSLGRTMTLTFSTAKRLTGLAAGSLQVAYTYTAGRVTKVTRTQGGQNKSRTYHYEDANEGGLLTGITDERNIRYVTWAYDTKGRVIRNELNGAQDKYLFTYNANGSTTVTNPLGKQATYAFQTIAGAKRISSLSGAVSANCPASNSTFTYNARGLIATRTDNKGYVTTYDYDSRGLEISRTEASGTPQARSVTTEWHPTLYKPVTITEPERVLHFEYDSQGNLLSQTITAL